MAGSRRESIGNILQRLQGLLRSGAVKAEDRPIWYDVVQSFPPKPVPPPRSVQKILYPEDFVRAHFRNNFSDRSMTNLKDNATKTVPERFVDTYVEIQRQKTVPSTEIFNKTVSAIKEQGYRLVTHEEAGKARAEKLRQIKETEQEQASKRKVLEHNTINVDDLFSEKT